MERAGAGRAEWAFRRAAEWSRAERRHPNASENRHHRRQCSLAVCGAARPSAGGAEAGSDDSLWSEHPARAAMPGNPSPGSTFAGSASQIIDYRPVPSHRSASAAPEDFARQLAS